MPVAEFRVPGISCQHCVMAIRKKVAALVGVQAVEGDPANKLIRVEHDGTAGQEEIVAAIRSAGYEEVVAL